MDTDDKATREEMKKEALDRMKTLQLSGNVVGDFRNSGRVYYSERQNSVFDGILYWLDNEDRFMKLKDAFEKKYGYLVYHAQLAHTDIGDMLTLLYVSTSTLEWEDDRNNLKDGYQFAYVCNLDDEDCSEFGEVGIKPCNGGVTRMW